MVRAKPRRPSAAAAGSVIPLPRAGAARPTPEQLVKTSVAKRPSPPGQPDRAEITLKLTLRQPVLELTARAIREKRNLEALVQEILEDAAE